MRFRLFALTAALAGAAFVLPAGASYVRTCTGTVDTQCRYVDCRHVNCFWRDCAVYVDPHLGYAYQLCIG